MMTRSIKSRQVDEQLRIALEQLKNIREKYDILLQESEQNEEEMLSVISKNTDLKKQLSQLFIEHSEALEINQKLQDTINTFSQCSDEFCDSLKITAELRHKLAEADDCISDLRSELCKLKEQQPQSLYSELVQSEPSLVAVDTALNFDITTIDLTGSDAETSERSQLVLSKNKLRKYVKINKLIYKTQRKLRNYKSQEYIKFICKQRTSLSHQVAVLTEQSQQIHHKHMEEIECLSTQINNLKSSLENITLNYELAQRDISEHVLAMDNLIDTCNYNQQRFDSLTMQYAECKCSASGCQELPHVEIQKHNVSILSVLESQSNDIMRAAPICLPTTASSQVSREDKIKIKIFSDELGKQMGVALHDLCFGQHVINYCMPGANPAQIFDKILNTTHCLNTVIIIMLGRRENVNQKQILHYVEQVNMLNIKKIIMFTFPYLQDLPTENKIRFNINNAIYNAFDNNNCILTSKKYAFKLIDLNNIIKFRYLRTSKNEIFKLTNKNFRQVATSLHYFIHNFLAINLAKKIPASIEQEKNMTCYKTLESASNLN